MNCDSNSMTTPYVHKQKFFFFLLLQNSLIWCRYNAWAHGTFFFSHGKYFWFQIFFKSWALNTTHRKNLKTMSNFFLNTENESNEIKWCRRKNKINDVIGKWKKILGACMKRDCMKACGSSKVHETPSHSLRQHIAGMSVRNVSINRYINCKQMKRMRAPVINTVW